MVRQNVAIVNLLYVVFSLYGNFLQAAKSIGKFLKMPIADARLFLA